MNNLDLQTPKIHGPCYQKKPPLQKSKETA